MIQVRGVNLGLFTLGLLLILRRVYRPIPLLVFEIVKDFKIAFFLKNLLFFGSLEFLMRKGYGVKWEFFGLWSLFLWTQKEL